MELTEQGVSHVKRSSLGRHQPSDSNNCLLVDSTGELTAFYAEADVVFVGKSLCARGGQNPIEPAALGKAMVFGSNMQNFPGVTRQLIQAEAAVQVAGEAELEQVLGTLLRSVERRTQLGRNALEVVHRNTGATVRTANLILNNLPAEFTDLSGSSR